MLKKICICDKCGIVVEEPIIVAFGLMDIESQDCTCWKSEYVQDFHFCETCAETIHECVSGKKVNIEKEQPKEEKKKRSVKIDAGKIIALKEAGWAIKDIADEMNLTTSQVSNAIYYEKAKEKQKSHNKSGVDDGEK